jgi:putative membrane protein
VTRLSRWVALATLIGLAAALWVLGQVGLAQVAHSILRVGVGGFLLYVLVHAVALWVLGLAWARSAAVPMRPVRLFAWARTVREAANELLPFSQLGGLFVGIRVILAAHSPDGALPPARVYASTVIDSLTEIASQIVYVLAGLAILGLLAGHAQAAGITAAAWAGVGVLGALTVAAVALQRHVLAFAGRVAGRFVPGIADAIGAVQAELAAVGRRPGALLASFAANLVAWLIGAGSSWLALRLLGAPIPVWSAVALEAVISVVRSGAFLIPGAIGAQELGYAALAPLVGIPAEAALAVSLLKRARDLAIGVPALLMWQAGEARRTTPSRA